MYSRGEALRVFGLVLAGGVLLPASEVAAGTEQKICRIGRRFLGTPYVRGGRNLHVGVDCDGFTKKVMRRAGIYVSWGPANQFYGGRKRKGPPHPGDIVAFNENGRGISHVGIYSGGGYLLHASTYFNQVVESEMKYIRGFVGASVYR